MAKNKNELTYLQSPLPEGQKYYKSTKLSFSGLNRRHTLDTGELSYAKNISTVEAPYLTPSPECDTSAFGGGRTILDIFGFDNFVVVVLSDSGSTVMYFMDEENSNGLDTFAYCTISETDTTSHRSIVQFNVYDTPTDVVSGDFSKKLLVFPDKVSIDIAELLEKKNYSKPPEIEPASLETETLKIPDLKYVTVHLSRLFGVDDDRVYASGFNDYANWNLDTAGEYNESNAWCSPAQANTRADSKFTGITTYQNHVVCFKRNFMHEIYNTKNPFRIQDIYAEGTIDNRTIQDVDGRLIFVSDDNVKIYTGSNPRIISYNLNIPKYETAVSGQDGRNYYLFVTCGKEEHLFVYDTMFDVWSERYYGLGTVKGFASNSVGMYMCTNNTISKLDTNEYSGQDWAFETGLITNNTVDIKHIKKLQWLGDFENCQLDVYILYDDEEFDENASHKVFSSTERLNGRKAIRVKPRNTANYGFKIHFEGLGYAKLYELEIFAQQGGDLYV